MAKTSTKLPKAILGVPVPKALRRSSAIKDVLASQLAREVIADVLVAAASAAAAALRSHSQSGAPPGAGERTSSDNSGMGTLGTAVSEVARTLLSSGEDRKAKKNKLPKVERKRGKGERVSHH